MRNAAATGQRMRTSVRLSLQFAFLYSILTAGIFAAAYWYAEYEVRGLVMEQMEGDAAILEKLYRDGRGDELIPGITALTTINHEGARVFQVLDENGKVLAGNITNILPQPVQGFLAVEALQLPFEPDAEVNGFWMRQDAIGPYILVQGIGNHVIGEVLEALMTALAYGLPAVVVLGLLAGLLVGRVTERRISTIHKTLSTFSDGNLDARVAKENLGGDDLGRVAVEINAALDQIENLMVSQEQISNDIAHDLRTPLQRLRQRLERMRDGAIVERSDIDAGLRQTEDIISTFNALLSIAQIEASNRTRRFASLDVNDVLSNVVDAFLPAAEDAGHQLVFRASEQPAIVHGDTGLLTQLFSNLVENAIIHCPAGAKIEVAIEQGAAGLVVRVADDGPGIAKESRERIFERFFRGERSRSSPGHGLGLALAKAICDLHGAQILVGDNSPGAVISVRF